MIPVRQEPVAAMGGVEAASFPRAGVLGGFPLTLTFDRSVNRTGRETFAGLDVLRVLAALMILVYHAHSIATKNALRQDTTIFAEPTWWYACIDLFFVMSGFLMVHMGRSLYGAPRGALVFASRRLVRTPPLYWVYTLVFALVWTLFPQLPGATFIGPARLLESLFFIPTGSPPIILVAWTLYLEIFFYVVFGLSLLLPFSRGPWVAMAVLGGMTLLGLVPGFATSHFGLWTDPLMLDFCLGMAVALLYFRGATLHALGRAGVIVLALVAVAALPELGSRNFLRVPTFGLSAACLVALATWGNGNGIPQHLRQVTSALGATAYSLYLSHIVFLKIFEALFFRVYSGRAACYAYLVLGCLFALVGGWIAYRFVERPLTRGLKPLALKR